jgi:protein DGCR14
MKEFARPKPKVRPLSNVMDEDEYLAKLEAIIKRDFFPELKTLEELRNGYISF